MSLYYGVQQFNLNGIAAQIGMYFRNTNLAFPFVANAWSSALTSLFQVDPGDGFKYIDMMHNTDSLTYRWVYKIDPFTDLKIDQTTPTTVAVAGTNAGVLLPRPISVMSMLRPAVLTGGVGRVYLPRVTASRLNNGDLHVISLTAVSHYWAAFLADFGGNLCTPVLRNREMHTDVPVVKVVTSPRLAFIKSRADTSRPVYL